MNQKHSDLLSDFAALIVKLILIAGLLWVLVWILKALAQILLG